MLVFPKNAEKNASTIEKGLATALLPGTQAHNRLREAKMRINRKFDKTVKIQFLK